jgi:hypothetical protein
MKFIIMAIVAVLGLAGFTVTAKKKMEPRIVAQHEGRDCCDSRDGLLPACQSMVYVIENPLRQTITVELSCGSELINPRFDLTPRVRQEVEVCPEVPGKISCFILSWEKKGN